MTSESVPVEQIVAESRYLRLLSRRGWEFVERRGSRGIVVVVAVTERGGLVLVTQWREPVQAWVVELPAGLAGDLPGQEKEDLAVAARRELLEETGFEATSWRPLLRGPPSPGISSERVVLYLARGLKRIGRGGGDGGNEKVRAHVIPLRRLEAWLASMQRRGCLVDPKVLAGAWLAQKEIRPPE